MSDHEDMSPWAVHFTQARALAPPTVEADSGGGLSHRELAERLSKFREESSPGYENIMSILWDGHIEPFREPHGAGKDIPELAEDHRSAAFSEIPLQLLTRLVRARSPFGIGFSQDFLLENGGGRVWYLETTGAIADAVRSQVMAQSVAPIDRFDPFWRTTPFIDFPDPSRPFEDWRWEREWRVPGGLRFEPGDVAFLFIPERFHADANRFFTEHREANTGPAYLCPYIDVTWRHLQIEACLRAAGL